MAVSEKNVPSGKAAQSNSKAGGAGNDADAKKSPQGVPAEESEITASDVFEQLRLAHKRKRELSQMEVRHIDDETAKIRDEVNSIVGELSELSVRKKRARLEGKAMDFGPADKMIREKMLSIYPRAKSLATGERISVPAVSVQAFAEKAVVAAERPPALAPAGAAPVSPEELAGKRRAAACPPDFAFKIVETIIDDVCRVLEGEKDFEIDIDELALRLKIPPFRIEAIGKMLQDAQLAQVIYPVNVFARPRLRLSGRLALGKEEAEGETVFECSFLSNDLPITVHVTEVAKEERPVYRVNGPRLGPYSEAFLMVLRDELAREVPVQTEEITDPKAAQKIKERFSQASFDLLEKKLPELSGPQKTLIVGLLLQRMYGLGEIDVLMADDNLEEIGVNSVSEPISVYHRKFGWMKTNLRMPSEEEIYNYASQIGRKSGRDISLLSPVMDAWLSSGDRVSATLFPISSGGNTITIRRFARNPWTITNFIDPKINTMSVDMAAFLWMCVQYELNIMVAGGTASGKTSTLNTLCSMIPSIHRTITIEDTRELQFPSYLKWNWISLATRGPNQEGKGEVSMLDLMVSSLRMRPDRLVLGEIRRKEEAEVLFEAMYTGHSVYSTIHADSSKQAIRRLVEPPIEIPTTELDALQVILVQYRDRRRGIRRTSELTEISPAGAHSKELGVNTLFRWHPRTDSFEKVNESTRVFSELGMHTGMTVKEMQENLSEKQDILAWMYAREINTTELVGKVMKAYYKDAEKIVGAARENAEPQSTI